MTLLGIDIGTTNCKAALFDRAGVLLQSFSQPVTYRRGDGLTTLDPGALWKTVLAVVGAALQGQDAPAAVGITGMAETGLLFDPGKGEPRTPFFPWFDQSAVNQAEDLSRHQEMADFFRSGIRPSYKCSLARLLWLRDEQGADVQGLIWLGAADYAAYRMTGRMATDYSLAGRTYAFDIQQKTWDAAYLNRFGLNPALFPEPQPAVVSVGRSVSDDLRDAGVSKGTPVSIGGHDHVCAAFGISAASGLDSASQMFDSMGTAETVMGVYPRPEGGSPVLGEKEYRSGLSYGCHVLPDHYYWMGGLSTSGGAVEWLRAILGDPALSYEDLGALLEDAAPAGPSGILFFPYLAGSGSPHTDSAAKAPFVGLSAAHRRAHLVQAVLEGTSFETEFIRRTAQRTMNFTADQLVITGGGARNQTWMQVKANATGCQVIVPQAPEAASFGAALLAGTGSGYYGSLAEGFAAVHKPGVDTYEPDRKSHQDYQWIYEHGYEPLQEPMRRYYSTISKQNRQDI